MNSNVPVVVDPVAAEAGVQLEPRSFLSDLAKVTVIYMVAYGTLLGILLHQYV